MVEWAEGFRKYFCREGHGLEYKMIKKDLPARSVS